MPSGTDPSPTEVIQSLAAVAHPLEHVEPAGEHTDIDPLLSDIAAADVIGLGEASHGTRDFVQFKHRLLRALIERQGLRLITLETNFAATLALADFVRTGRGSPTAALSQNGIHDGYQVQAMADLVEWIRDFNEHHDDGDAVHIHGIDIQHPGPAADRLHTYLARTAPAVLESIRGSLERLQRCGIPDFQDEQAVASDLETRQKVVNTLRQHFESTPTVQESEDVMFDSAWMRRLVWMLDQGRRQFQAIHDGRASTGANVRIRDSAMAAQVQWLMRQSKTDRVAVWGHNAHLTRGAFGGGTVRHTQGIPSLGQNLSRLSGIEYYALGLILGGGVVGATYVPDGTFRGYEIEEPPDGSVPAMLSAVDGPQHYLDLRSLDADSAGAQWLDSGPLHYDIVGGYEDSPVELIPTDYRRQFDGVVFVRKTTPTEPIHQES